jgi:hypothetical protein
MWQMLPPGSLTVGHYTHTCNNAMFREAVEDRSQKPLTAQKSIKLIKLSGIKSYKFYLKCFFYMANV